MKIYAFTYFWSEQKAEGIDILASVNIRFKSRVTRECILMNLDRVIIEQLFLPSYSRNDMNNEKFSGSVIVTRTLKYTIT